MPTSAIEMFIKLVDVICICQVMPRIICFWFCVLVYCCGTSVGFSSSHFSFNIPGCFLQLSKQLEAVNGLLVNYVRREYIVKT